MEKTPVEIIDVEIKRGSSEYPKLLAEIPDSPGSLFVKIKKGIPLELSRPAAAVVGTRKATSYGESLASTTAEALAHRGLAIVSGLALGIDAASHRGALRAGGRTVAVLAGGLDKIYPPQNERLAEEILQSGGALISEYPPGTPPFKQNFLARNRIISGLSFATVVIEAPRISGAIQTARLAAEQGREVFVFPGGVGQPNYVGSHALIRDGARLATSAEEILDDLGFGTEKNGSTKQPPAGFSSAEEQAVYSLLRQAGRPLAIDKIIEETKLQPQSVGRALASLAIKRIIKEERGRYSI